jgi:acyl-CoA synthetase (AMP-forming)/AMP-acid ligase II
VLADVLAAGAGALPGLRRAVVAGAALPGGTRARAAAAGVGLAEYYGAAELSFVAADADGAGLRAFPGARLDVREGVVWVRSPYLAQGYLDHLDGEGALRRDGAGWATVGGTTVTLADVERALGGSPGVAEVVALAEPDRRFGERVLVVVRPHPADPLRTAARRDLLRTLRCLARAELPPAARPVRYIVREDLPRSPGGKVARTALAAQVVPATGTAGPDPRTLAP